MLLLTLVSKQLLVLLYSMSDCKRTYFIGEKDTDPLRIFKPTQSALDINPNMTCSPREALFSYQACDGGWTPLDQTTANRGLRVTTQWSNSTLSYILKVRQFRDVARIFQRGGHTVSNNMVIAFSPRNIVGCFLKKGLQRRGHGHPRIPPRYALSLQLYKMKPVLSGHQPQLAPIFFSLIFYKTNLC